MADPRLALDHVGVIVRDLVAATLRWERLGFMLAPQSRQRGAVPGQPGMQPWATANRCAVFRQGYLELIGVVDPNAFNPWRRFLDRFEGLHLLAARCADADAAFRRLAPTATFLDAPVARERKLDYAGEERTMRFRNIFSRDSECPEGRYIVIEHQTPELLWQPQLMAHENGACSLEEAWIVTDDPAIARRVAALDGFARVIDPQAFAARYDWMPQVPSIAAITLSFSDLAHAVQYLQERGVSVRRRGEDVWLGPEETNGFVIRLIQHA